MLTTSFVSVIERQQQAHFDLYSEKCSQTKVPLSILAIDSQVSILLHQKIVSSAHDETVLLRETGYVPRHLHQKCNPHWWVKLSIAVTLSQVGFKL